VVGQDDRGAIVLRQKWSRGQIEARLANLPPCLIGMEACVGAHHLSRKLKAFGHDARLMPAKYVRLYSKGQKNDFRDAEAIAEAVQRPTMKFVATKTGEQLDLQALHRKLSGFVSATFQDFFDDAGLRAPRLPQFSFQFSQRYHRELLSFLTLWGSREGQKERSLRRRP
jgi:transposase